MVSSTKSRVAVAVALVVGLLMSANIAMASVLNVDITAPEQPTTYIAGSEVNVSFDFLVERGADHCNAYASTIRIGSAADPLVTDSFHYHATQVDCDPTDTEDVLNSRTHKLTIPEDATAGAYDLYVLVEEFGVGFGRSSSDLLVGQIIVIGCAPGWELVVAGADNPADKNGDGFVCQRDVPAPGRGNTGGGTNQIDTLPIGK